MTDTPANYTSKPVKQRIVLWSALAMIFSLLANVILLTMIFTGNLGMEPWFLLSLALSAVLLFATIAFIVSVIIRLVERANRKSQLSAEIDETLN